MNTTGDTVLLVEDDPNDTLLVQRAFGKLGRNVKVVAISDGEEAISYLGGHHRYANRELHQLPALMLLDLKLPRVSGLEVLAWLRQQHTLRRLPVVILSSSSQPGDINRAYDLGANSYLVKPVSFEDLQSMIATLCHYWLDLAELPNLNLSRG